MKRSILLAILAFAPQLRADNAIPVYVSVTGSGEIRVLLAAGGVVPCDSTSNVRLFDGRMAAGRYYVLSSPQTIVCERHTYGAFRDAGWSPDRQWAWPALDYPGAPMPPWRIEIPLSTDDP